MSDVDLVTLTDDHRYVHADGHQVISVSTALRKGNIRPAPYAGRTKFGVNVMAKALARGTEVHRITRQMDETGDMDDVLDAVFEPTDLTYENINYVSANQKFLTTSGYRPLAWEKILYHGGYDYAGRVDGVGWVPWGRRVLRGMIDRKTDITLHPAVWLQLAAYREAWNWLYPTTPIDQTFALKLCNDTTFELIPNPLEPNDFPYFAGALWVARWHGLQL